MDSSTDTTPPKKSKKQKPDYSSVLEIILLNMPKEILTHYYFRGVRLLLPFLKVGIKIPPQDETECWIEKCAFNDLTNRGWCGDACFKRLCPQIRQTSKLPSWFLIPSDYYFYGEGKDVSYIDLDGLKPDELVRGFSFKSFGQSYICIHVCLISTLTMLGKSTELHQKIANKLSIL